MTSRRPPSDGDSSRARHTSRVWRQIGTRIAEVRQARQLSVEDVAARLILSRAQVIGLECGDPTPFYTPVYFLRGLRKYMAFTGVPEDVLDLAEPEEEPPPVEAWDELRMTLADPSDSADRHRVLRSLLLGRHWAITGTVTILAVSAAVLLRVASAPLIPGGDSLQLATMAPLPAQPLHLAAEAPIPVPAMPASTNQTTSRGVRVSLSVGKATWVSVRYLDDRVVERRLAAGEAFEVGPLPQDLTIGTADSVELRVEDRPVALEPYIRNGQVHITRPQLAVLTDRGASR